MGVTIFSVQNKFKFQINLNHKMVKKLVSKETKVKSVEKIVKMKKPPTKLELEIEVKKLLQANDALEESIRKKIELLETY